MVIFSERRNRCFPRAVFGSTSLFGLALWMFSAIATEPVRAEFSVTLGPTDLKGLFLDLSANPTPGPNDLTVTPDADIFRSATIYRAAYAEYAIAGLNPDGIFSARMVGSILASESLPTGNRWIASTFYQGDGVVQSSDAFAPPVRNPSRFYPDFVYDTATASSVVVNMDVTRELREIANQGGTHFGVRYEAANFQGASTVSPLSPIILEVTEYYANPMDAVPEIVGGTGMALRGQDDHFVTQGAARVMLPDEWAVFTRRNMDNGIGVTLISLDNVNRWDIDFAAPGDALLQIGDSFEASRFSFQSPSEGGLGFGGEGRGANQLAGSFTIHDVLYDLDGSVLRLDAEFIHRDLDGNTFGNPVAFGRVQFNAIAVPEPTSLALLVASAGAWAAMRRRRPQRNTLPADLR